MRQFVSDATVEFMAAKRVQEQATGSLMEAQKLATQIKYELSDAKRGFDSDLNDAKTGLADLREALTNLFGPGAVIKPNEKPVIAYNLSDMQNNISELVGKVASLDAR